VLDVNSSFGPWLVEPQRLLEAMTTGGGFRGLARFERLANGDDGARATA
jgi:hypothetical protein